MADTVIYVRDSQSGALSPLKLVDNNDGTYSLGPSGGEASQTTLLLVKTSVDTIASVIGSPQTLSPANDTVTQGFYAATTLHAVDADLAVGNIKTGVNIFGFVGTYDTEVSNPIVAARMKTGDVAFVNGAKVTGSGTKTLDPANDTVAAGYYAATTLSAVDADLASANIKSGVTIFGISGSTDVRDSTDATAVAAEVKTGSTFYAGGGAKKTGSGTQTLSAANDTVAAGYYSATTLHAVDADLATANIKAGVNIFGIDGKTEVVDTTEVGNPVVAARMKTGDVAFVNGSKVTGSGTQTLSAASTTVPAGYYAATDLATVDTDLVAGNIKAGVTIFGILGTYTP